MGAIVLIPARLAATRLPNKPLADIGGTPMIVRVLRQAELAGVGPVVVAAGDRAIVEAVEAAGGRAVLTDPDLPSGTDRLLGGAWRVRRGRGYDPQRAGRHALRGSGGHSRVRRPADRRADLRHRHHRRRWPPLKGSAPIRTW